MSGYNMRTVDQKQSLCENLIELFLLELQQEEKIKSAFTAPSYHCKTQTREKRVDYFQNGRSFS